MSRLFAGLFAMLFLASACSGTPFSRGEDSAGSGDGSETMAEDLAMGAVVEVRLGLRRPTSYRPNEVVLTDQSAVIVSDLLYDGLTETVGRDGLLRPGLASEWSSDEFFKEWTFTLDDQAAVSAEVVVESLTPFTGGGSGRRAGASAILAADIESVVAVDDATIVVRLRSSNAGLPWVLSGLPFSIVGADDEPTGDFEVTSDDTNGMIFGRRDERASSDGVQRVVVTWTEDASAAKRALNAKLVDAALTDGSAIPIVPTIDPESDRQPLQVATTATRFYVLNPRSASLSDINTRQAVLAAIDRWRLPTGTIDQDLVMPDGLVGADMSGYRVDACGVVCLHDRDLVSDVEPLSVELAYVGEEQRKIAAAIADQLTRAGIETKQNELSAQDLARAIVDGRTDMFSFGWVAAATSSDAVIPPLLTVDSPANVARIDSPRVADLLARAAVTEDDLLRWSIQDQAHRLALSEALILPVAGSASMLQQQPDLPPLTVRADGSIDLEKRG